MKKSPNCKLNNHNSRKDSKRILNIDIPTLMTAI